MVSRSGVVFPVDRTGTEEVGYQRVKDREMGRPM